jgi:hypothetical protein
MIDDLAKRIAKREGRQCPAYWAVHQAVVAYRDRMRAERP